MINICFQLPDEFPSDEVKHLSDLAQKLAVGIAPLGTEFEEGEIKTNPWEQEAHYRKKILDISAGFNLHEIIWDRKEAAGDERRPVIDPAFEILLGLRREYVIGRSLNGVSPKNASLRVRLHGGSVCGDKPKGPDSHFEGLQDHCEVIVYQPAHQQFAVTFKDDEKCRRVEDGLRRKIKEQSAAIKAKNELLAAAAHDLKTPLAVIGGFCQIINRLQEGGSPRSVFPFIDKISYQAKYMSRLVEDLLEITALTSDNLPLRVEPTDISTMLTRIVDLQREHAAGKNINVEHSISSGLPRLVIDRNKIEQVINNLISNAIKFSPRDSTVTLEAQRRDDVIECKVQDQGVGIPRTDFDKIFMPFFKGVAHGTAGEKGNGLGLAIAQKITAAHGGELLVESEVGNGSVFKLILPVQDRGTSPVSPSGLD